jgi:pimeloyl-ACP methyl ester carboxylesterase
VPTLEIDGATVDYRLAPASATATGQPPLVFLHEGLGSIEQWRDFPADVRAAAGEPATLVFSRPGYGHSTVKPPPWPVGYMHREALAVLPAVLARLGLERPILVGHSDGASIALIHAGAGHSVAGVVAIAPHVFVEDRSVAGIEAARLAFEEGGLRARLARYHDDVDATFWGWNRVWLSPQFRAWNIEAGLPPITAPVLVVQGEADAYGTLAQVRAIERGAGGRVESLLVAGGGHVLHLGDTDALVARIAAFCAAL